MFKQHRAEETHSRILAAARECFARDGYDATGVAELCQVAGISKGAFYHHFQTKHDVFVELLRHWLAALDDQLERLRADAASIPDALIAMTGVVRHIYQTKPEELLIFLEFLNKAARDPRLLASAVEPFRRYQDYFAGMIRQGIAEGTLCQVDPDGAARILISMALGLLAQGLVDRDRSDWEAVTRQGIEMIVEGLKNPNSQVAV